MERSRAPRSRRFPFNSAWAWILGAASCPFSPPEIVHGRPWSEWRKTRSSGAWRTAWAERTLRRLRRRRYLWRRQPRQCYGSRTFWSTYPWECTWRSWYIWQVGRVLCPSWTFHCCDVSESFCEWNLLTTRGRKLKICKRGKTQKIIIWRLPNNSTKCFLKRELTENFNFKQVK